MQTLLLTKLIAAVLTMASGQNQPQWRPPVANPAHLMAGFRSPNSDYSSGHRGIDYLVWEQQSILSPSDGTVAFVGVVAGKPVLTIQHSPSLRSALEPVCSSLKVGDRVVTGQIIGSVCGRGYHSHCEPLICLHYSLRSYGRYLSPLVLTGGLPPSVLIPAH